MDPLTQRQNELLQIIVGTYVKTVTPVGSGVIAKSYPDLLSPATIRNEMHDLEEQGFIKQPHTSAGRIPTDKGYRYYVDYLMPETKVAAHIAALVAREYREPLQSIDQLIDRTSKILSSLSEQAGLVIFPDIEDLLLKRIELTSLDKRHILVVWIAGNGFVQNRLVDFKEEIPDPELKRINRFLNEELCGMHLSEIKDHLREKITNSQDSRRGLFRNANSLIYESFPRLEPRKLSLEGSRFILDQPEFQDWEKSKRLFKILEERDSLLNAVQKSKNDGVTVQIGFEHHCPDIWDCSIVTAQYRVNEKKAGLLGVLGPRRMAYEKVISLVDFMSRRFGEALEQWF